MPEIRFLNVLGSNGYGDSTWITDGNTNLLFDGGYSGKLSSLMKKYPQGEKWFQHVFLTHYHDDHYAGILYLLEQREIDHLYIPDVLWPLLVPNGPTRVCSNKTQRTKRLFFLANVLQWFSQIVIWAQASMLEENLHFIKPYNFPYKEGKEELPFHECSWENKINDEKFQIEYSCRFPKIWQGKHLLSKKDFDKLKHDKSTDGNVWWEKDSMQDIFNISSQKNVEIKWQVDKIIEQFNSVLLTIKDIGSKAFIGEDVVIRLETTLRYFKTLFHRKDGVSSIEEYEFIQEWLLFLLVWKEEFIALQSLITTSWSENIPKKTRLLISEISTFIAEIQILQVEIEKLLTPFGEEILEVLKGKKHVNQFWIVARVSHSHQELWSILITGDMHTDSVCDFLNDLPSQNCYFVKASHHGSTKTNDTDSINNLAGLCNAKEYFVPNDIKNGGKSWSGVVVPHPYFLMHHYCKWHGDYRKNPYCETYNHEHNPPFVHFSGDNPEMIYHPM